MGPRTGEPGRCSRIGPWATQRGAVQTRGAIGAAGFRPPGEDEIVDRTEKREFVASLGQVFAETSMVVVTRNDGMTVAQVSDLRRRMRASGSTYKVAKNRLAVLALDGTRFDGIAPMLKGPTALAWSRDPVAVAKAAVDYAKVNERFVVLGGALGPQMLDAEGIKALADLPSLDQLRGKLLGLLQAPATRIAGVLQAPAGQLARVFAAYAKRDEEGAAEKDADAA